MWVPTTPSEIGARAEAEVTAALVRAGKRVYLPTFAAHARVDLVHEDDAGLVRVQCKSAFYIHDTLRFLTCSNTANTPISYAGQVDAFGIFSPHTGRVYLVPNVDLPSRACCLRLRPTRNWQVAGVRWASDFELGPP